MNTFLDSGLDSRILDAIKELGFETPTPIQAKSIPHLMLSDRDLIASAQTGTGKTAAFGLPAIHLTDIGNKRTQTLILCPTRELCVQITRDIINFSKNIKGLGIVAVYGGATIQPQIRALTKGAQIVVATPGRAKDLIKRKKLVLGSVVRVVLDEADEMLSMGFREDIDSILAQTPKKKQILLFCATMSKDIISITKKFMRDPLEISAARVNLGAENVRHVYYMVHARDRYELLKRIADINPNIYGIVFCRTRRETKEIANKLIQDGYNADALHGDLSQGQRDEVMGRFRKRALQILVATDVAARGIDVEDLTHIINYNLPDEIEIYTHRSGRTGRAGKSGISIAIIHTREIRRIKEIEKRSGITFSKETAPSGKDICTTQLYSLIDKIEKVKVDDKQIEPFLPTIYEKLEWLSREELIKHFVSAEFNRFLDYSTNDRDIN
ncbi:MAG: DEAD/DEAH box helicase, partial [Bacteroidetes bacterium]|nr:DEAD/DEAH box helicase [Bacteroidota bacterium]